MSGANVESGIQGPPNQVHQTTAPSVPVSVPQNQTIYLSNDPPTMQAPPALNHGHGRPEQYPPTYNDVYGKENPGINPVPQVQQPQPWGQQFQPNYQSNVAITAQPQPMPSNVVLVNSAPQRNESQGVAIASLVMTIVGLFCCGCATIFCSIPAIIFAALSLGNSTDSEKARSHAKISMTCTVIGWICGVIIVVVYCLYIFSFSYY